MAEKKHPEEFEAFPLGFISPPFSFSTNSAYQNSAIQTRETKRRLQYTQKRKKKKKHTKINKGSRLIHQLSTSPLQQLHQPTADLSISSSSSTANQQLNHHHYRLSRKQYPTITKHLTTCKKTSTIVGATWQKALRDGHLQRKSTH